MLPTTIKSRLVAVLFIALAGMIAVSGFALSSLRDTLLDDRKVKTRNLVEVAAGIVEHFHEIQKSGSLNETQAKAAALAALKTLRYDQSEYFWVNDMSPKVVMHPIKPELDGKDVSGVKDPNGKALFIEFVNIAKTSKAGFVDYAWPKPGQDAPVPKISYIKSFEPWGWVIGSGIYIDDVQQVFRSRAMILIAIELALAVVMGGLLFYVIRSISKPLDNIKDVMKSMQETNNLT